MPAVDAYHFTLRFRVPDHEPVLSAEALAPFPGVLGLDRLELRPEDGRELSEARRLFLSGQGYDAENQAREAGERARRALLLAALESDVGVEWGDDPGRGLSVWGGGPRLVGRTRSGGSGTVTKGVGVEMLRDRFARWLAKAPGLKPRQATAAELLSAVHFDASDRSRFLVAYAALEELGATDPKELKALGLEPAKRSDAYLTALERLVDHLDKIETDQDTKEGLRSSLLHLQGVQETGRCKKLIKDVLGPKVVRTFNRLAKVRRDIAHKGLSLPEGGRLSFEAYHLARDLLFGMIARQRS